VAELARGDFEALMRYRDAKTGFTLDRTLFRDLAHVGATGWLLASLPTAADQDWLTETEAKAAGLQVLRFLDNPALWCDAPTGCVGTSMGLVYRFTGIDPAGLNGPLTGTRKIDVGGVNNVEASVIDTAILQMGAATFASGFRRDTEIKGLVDRLLARTRWDQILDPVTGQLRMAWKPELDPSPPDLYTVAAANGGYWASTNAGQALTIDYWTDEGAMAAILAAGSSSNPIGPEPWYRMIRARDTGPRQPVVSWPGSWFTMSFLTATYLDPGLGADNGRPWGVESVDWHLNARRFYTCATLSTGALPDAVELPDTTYRAQGTPACAADPAPFNAGTRSPYSLQLALGLGGPASTDALRRLRETVTTTPAVWDPLIGLLDAYQPDLATFPQSAGLIRSSGLWIQQQVWPLNKGAALLSELNYLDDGAIWRDASRHPAIARGLKEIYKPRR
jgi:hypothetical protein